MTDQSEIDAGWDDLLGDVDDTSAPKASAPAPAPAVPRVGAAVTVPTVEPPASTPRVPRLGSTPDATPAVPSFSPPGAKGEDGLLVPPPTVGKSSDYTPLRLGGDDEVRKPAAPSFVPESAPDLGAGASLLPPPPEYTPPSSTAEGPLEVRTGLEGEDDEGSSGEGSEPAEAAALAGDVTGMLGG